MCKTIIIKDEDVYMIATEGIIDTSATYGTLPLARAAALAETKRTGLKHLVIHVVCSATIKEND